MKGWRVATTIALGMTVRRGSAQAAASVGTVATSDALVTGASGGVVKVVGGMAQLVGSSSVTAKAGYNAEVTLTRGGHVTVCQTSVLHTTASEDASLLLALDRGAMEIRMNATAGDVVMTPDLRVTLASAGPLELEMRVSRNGDTCVENHGRKAPVLNLTDSFGEASYQIKPGQHVLFEHGSLREVVDRETTPCGCPPEQRPGVSIAEAVLSGGQRTPEEHPFPVAVSEGLAAPEPIPADPAGGTHVVVGATLTYDPSAAKPAAEPPAAAPAIVAETAPQPAQRRSAFTAIGRFFRRIFVR